jgi:hypothetical protein
MNEERRREVAELVRQLRAISGRVESMKHNEPDDDAGSHLADAEDDCDKAIESLQMAIERSAKIEPKTVQRDGPATRLRKANERKKP